ncbi:MAG: PKD domain-containing protein [Flavobacteriales bacterium]|nr:PKD domain-containing protein [Flavobacteriales bacterium]
MRRSPSALKQPAPLSVALSFMAVLFGCVGVQGQCGPLIGTFPYSEGFEASAAWTSGGTGNDWAWGTPAHPLINSAGGGSKSWCVGGLTGSYYNSNERSYLESPCFDFTNLNTPRISFKIFWEVERQYDGMTFQYSTDGGLTYSNVGVFNEPPSCNTANWFNSNNLTNLPSSISPKHGWSGRIGSTQGSCQGGSGSQTWVTAKHCLGFLANAPSVRFRFFFGAGSVCNNFDGIAIDDILIEESDPVVASFSGDCDGTTIEFQNTSTPCPNVFSWNFGDPGSAQNTSTQENPSHTYTNPGTYTITLTATDGCGASGTTTQQISVLGVAITTTDPTCGQANGSLEAVVTGANGPVNYFWSPGGATTQTLSNAASGSYTVTVSAANSCSATATATLAPSVGDLALALSHTDVSCSGANDGTATAVVSGGVAPITLSWAPTGDNTATLTGLAPDAYTCTVSDSQGCTDQQTVTVVEPDPLLLTVGPDTAVCEGSALTLQAQASGGTGGYTYIWSPEGPAIAPMATTSYTVTATDAQGCTSAAGSITVTVSSSFQPTITVSDTAGCVPLCVTFNALPADAQTYTWDFGDGASGGGASAAHCYTGDGTFPVSLTVTDDAGCSGTVTIPDLVDAYAAPAVSFSAAPPITTIKDPTFHFNSSSSNATEFSWHFGDPANTTSMEPAPSFTYPAVDCYTVRLMATSAEGCSDSASAEVCVEDLYAVFMPNAFTPNGDDVNDVLLPFTTVRSPKEYRLMIFDRWGTPMFTTEDIHQGWDGGNAPLGVYVWKVWITDSEGNAHEVVGHVTLLL